MHPDVERLLTDWTTVTITMARGRKREISVKRIRLFAEKLEVTKDGCWHWIGRLIPAGYGMTKVQGVGISTHRFAYLAFVGPIPEGMHLDHACHTEAIGRGDCLGGNGCLHRRCANPQHLKPVTPRENALISLSFTAEHARRTHCVNGHLLEGDDLYLRTTGGRACYQCHRDSDRRRRREKAEQEGRTVLPLPQDRSHCVNGHAFDESNTKKDKRGQRVCRACANERSRAYRERKKAKP